MKGLNSKWIAVFGGMDSNLRAKKMQKLNGRIKVQCQFNDRNLEFIVGSSGFHFAENSLGVLLCADCLGADIEKASQDLAKWEPSSGRGSFEKILLPSGNIFLIDDAFNANPSSMKSALQLLTQRTLNCSRRVAFLGDMLELGQNEVMLHEEIISWPELADVDIIHTLGPLMYHLHKKLPFNIKGCHYESKNELISDLENILQEGDKVLVKSSKSIGLSSIVDAIRAMKK